MKKTVFFSLFISSLFLLFSKSYSQKRIITEWQKSFGGERNEIAYAGTASSDGGYIIVGSTNSKNSFDVKDSKGFEGVGGTDFWIVKTKADGSLDWSKAFGGSKDETATSIVRTANNQYLIVGPTLSTDGDAMNNGTNGGILIVRIDEKGNLVSRKVLQGGNAGNGITYAPVSAFNKPTIRLLSDQKFLIACSRKNNTSPQTNYDFYLSLFTPEGDPLWAYQYGGTQEDYVHDLIRLDDGSYMMAGSTYSFPADIPGAGNGFLDMCLIKTDAAGKQIFKKAWGGKSIDALYSLSQSPSTKKIYLVGESNSTERFGNALGNKDAIFMSVDASGASESFNRLGGSEDDGFFQILAHTDGKIYMTGSSNSAIDVFRPKSSSSDSWMLILEEKDKSIYYQNLAGGADADLSRGIIIPSASGSLLQLGTSRSSDGAVSTNRGQGDFWIQFLAPPPPVLFSKMEAYLREDQTIEITWSTTQETNSKNFVIEKSYNKTDWSVYREIPAAINSIQLKNYRLVDLSSKIGRNYYRLKYTDAANKVYIGPNAEYNFIALSVAPWESKKFKTFPNPSNGTFSIEGLEEKSEIKLFNAMGQPVSFERKDLANTTQINLVNNYSSGVYIINIKQGDKAEFRRILINK
jgi:hypothetical protein